MQAGLASRIAVFLVARHRRRFGHGAVRGRERKLHPAGCDSRPAANGKLMTSDAQTKEFFQYAFGQPEPSMRLTGLGCLRRGQAFGAANWVTSQLTIKVCRGKKRRII